MKKSEQLCLEGREPAVRIGQGHRWPSLWATVEPIACSRAPLARNHCRLTLGMTRHPIAVPLGRPPAVDDARQSVDLAAKPHRAGLARVIRLYYALGAGWQAFTPAPITPDKEPYTP